MRSLALALLLGLLLRFFGRLAGGSGQAGRLVGFICRFFDLRQFPAPRSPAAGEFAATLRRKKGTLGVFRLRITSSLAACFIGCFLVIGTAHAAPPFNAADWVYQAAAWAAMTVDQGQTLSITDEPSYWEHNPILGHHPSRAAVNDYFAVAALADLGIARLLPRPARRAFQAGTALIEIGVSRHNYEIGLHLAF